MCQPYARRFHARRYPMTFSRRALLSLPRTRPSAPKGDGGFWLHLARTAMACRFEITLPSELGHHLDAAKDALDTIDALEDAADHLPRHQRAVAGQPGGGRASGGGRGAAVPAADRVPAPVAADRRRLRHHVHAAVAHLGLSAAAGPRCPPTTRSPRRAPAWACSTCGWIPPPRRCSSIGPGVSLNLGSIGKGYALDRVAEQMTEAGVPTALLTSGSSSLFALGAGHDGQGYEVGIRDPFDHIRALWLGATNRRGAGGQRGRRAVVRARRPPLRAHHRSAQRLAGRRPRPGRRGGAHARRWLTRWQPRFLWAVQRL